MKWFGIICCVIAGISILIYTLGALATFGILILLFGVRGELLTHLVDAINITLDESGKDKRKIC